MASNKEIEESVRIHKFRIVTPPVFSFFNTLYRYNNTPSRRRRHSKVCPSLLSFPNSFHSHTLFKTGLFDIYDKDGSDYIDQSELEMILKKVGRDSAQGTFFSSQTSPHNDEKTHLLQQQNSTRIALKN